KSPDHCHLSPRADEHQLSQPRQQPSHDFRYTRTTRRYGLRGHGDIAHQPGRIYLHLPVDGESGLTNVGTVGELWFYPHRPPSELQYPKFHQPGGLDTSGDTEQPSRNRGLHRPTSDELVTTVLPCGHHFPLTCIAYYLEHMIGPSRLPSSVRSGMSKF